MLHFFKRYLRFCKKIYKKYNVYNTQITQKVGVTPQIVPTSLPIFPIQPYKTSFFCTINTDSSKAYNLHTSVLKILY